MGTLSSLYLKKDTLQTMLNTCNAANYRGVEITISINDKTDPYGNNVNAWVSQTKVQSDAKAPRFFVGNGKVKYTNCMPIVPDRVPSYQESGQQPSPQSPYTSSSTAVPSDDISDLPF